MLAMLTINMSTIRKHECSLSQLETTRARKKSSENAHTHTQHEALETLKTKWMNEKIHQTAENIIKLMLSLHLRANAPTKCTDNELSWNAILQPTFRLVCHCKHDDFDPAAGASAKNTDTLGTQNGTMRSTHLVTKPSEKKKHEFRFYSAFAVVIVGATVFGVCVCVYVEPP